MKRRELEAYVLACLLIDPKLFNKLIVSEKHFKSYGYILTFFKEFYKRYKSLDIALMMTTVKDESHTQLSITLDYLMEVFVIPTHFDDYQKALITMAKTSAKEEWLRKKIYEKATELFIGNIDTDEFTREINSLYKNAERIKWE